MDFKLIISQSATEDLRQIIVRIARDNPSAALKLGNEILKRFEMLEKFPYLGRIVPEKGQPEWRELICKSYRLVYQVRKSDGLVFAARVWHAARGAPVIYD